jgi:hypothetical protein
MAQTPDAPKANGQRLLVYVNVTTADGELLERIAVMPREGASCPSVNSLAAQVVNVLDHRFETEE